MILPSSISPDEELRDFLQGQIHVGLAGGGSQAVTVYGDWERPTNGIPDDFIVIFLNGDVAGVGMDTPYADGYIMVSLYCKLNDDGSAKKNRIKKLLAQFEELVECRLTEHFFFKYDAERFITPTTPNVTSGYSVTNLNLRWHTRNNI